MTAPPSPAETRVPSPSRLLLLGLAPWPLVGLALYGLHSYRTALLAYHGLCLLSWSRWGQGRLGRPRHALASAAASLLMVLPLTLAIVLLSDPERLRQALAGFGFRPSHLAGLCLYFLAVHPLAEELFWRGTLFDGLQAAWGAGRAGLTSALLFASWHALVLVPLLGGWWWLGLLAVGTAGLVLNEIYRSSGQLSQSVLVHALAGDLPLVLVLLRVVQGG